MIKTETFRELALAMPNAVELPHFEKASFRVNEKIFATLDSVNSVACIKLSPVDQNVFTSVNSPAIYPVPNKWGKQGWTHIDLKKVRKNTLIDALTTSYYGAARSKNNERITTINYQL